MTTDELTALRNMSEPEIRRAQDIVRMQIPLAYQKGLTGALETLHEWEDDYANEMTRRLMSKATDDERRAMTEDDA